MPPPRLSVPDTEALPRCDSHGFSLNRRAATGGVPVFPPRGLPARYFLLECFARTVAVRVQPAGLLKRRALLICLVRPARQSQPPARSRRRCFLQSRQCRGAMAAGTVTVGKPRASSDNTQPSCADGAIE